jgi:hypothetical protein
MTERRRRPHAAAGARILSAAVSASLMIATVGNLVAAEHRKAAEVVALAVAPPATPSPAPLATALAAAAPPVTAAPVTAAPTTVVPPPAPRLVAPARTHARSHAS